MSKFARIMVLGAVMLAAVIALLFVVTKSAGEPGPGNLAVILAMGVVISVASVYLTIQLRRPKPDHAAKRQIEVSPLIAILVRVGGLVGVALFVAMVHLLARAFSPGLTSSAMGNVDIAAIIIALIGYFVLRFRYRPKSSD